MSKWFFLFTFLLTESVSYGQNRHTISGTIKESKTGETLIGATVYLLELPKSASLSNSYGFYSITAPVGHYTLVISFSGFVPDTMKIDLGKDLSLSIEMVQRNTELQEVVVSSVRQTDNIKKPLMGVMKLSVKEIQDMPVIFGEKDILKSLQLLPGVQSTGDGGSGFYVRGGTTDQNLILLDEATVYNPSHLLGFFSTFNSDAIKNIVVYKSGMPAQYGGRLSSVLDVRMDDGNSKKFQASGGIGLISSRLNIEGPIGDNDKGSFIVSGRRTYADLFLKLSKDST